jgi:hypothetical protein
MKFVHSYPGVLESDAPEQKKPLKHSYWTAPVLPTGRNFGRKTQNWPPKNISGWKNQRPNFWQIFQKMAEKWPNFFEVCYSHKNLHY